MQIDLFTTAEKTSVSPAIAKQVLPAVSIPGFSEVSKDEFYRVIGPQNVHVSVQGKFPFTTEFKTPYGQVKGLVVEKWTDGEDGKRPIVTRWYVAG